MLWIETPNFESKKDFLKIELRNLKSSSLKGFIERQWSATWFAGHRGRCLRLFASVHKCSRVTCEVKSLERPSVVRLLIVRLTTGLIIRTWMHSGHRSVWSVWLSVWFSVWSVWLSVWFSLYDFVWLSMWLWTLKDYKSCGRIWTTQLLKPAKSIRSRLGKQAAPNLARLNRCRFLKFRI